MAYHKAIVITTLGKRPIQMAEITDDGVFSDGGTRKRKRLTHLSADEKMMRRKLKNRVAAQTARDRKKAVMQDLEDKVSLLQEEKKQLLKENAMLRRNQSTMQKENEYLKSVSNVTTVPPLVATPVVTPAPVPCKVEVPDYTALPCKTEPDSPRSAAPAVSLPKEQIQSDALLHFLEEFCAQDGEFILEQEAQAEEPSSSPIGQLGVDTVVGEMSEGTNVVGSSAANMDTINELIQADHLYYKEEPNAPIVSCVSSISSSTVSTSLLPSREVTSTVVPSSVEDLGSEVIISGPVDVISDPEQYTGAHASTESIRQKAPTAVTFSFNANSKAAMTTMVNPNLVYSPRPKVTEPVSLDSTFLDMDVGMLTDELGLDCLLDLEDLRDMASTDQISSPQQQKQTVITVSASAPTSSTKSRSTKQKQNSSTSSTASPPSTENHVSSHTIFGLESDVSSNEFDKFQSGNLSPESGFTSDGSEFSSHVSDNTPSPDGVNSYEGDGFDWHEEFSVPLDLFPDVGLVY